MSIRASLALVLPTFVGILISNRLPQLDIALTAPRTNEYWLLSRFLTLTFQSLLIKLDAFKCEHVGDKASISLSSALAFTEGGGRLETRHGFMYTGWNRFHLAEGTSVKCRYYCKFNIFT